MIRRRLSAKMKICLCENYQSTCLSGGVAGVSAGLGRALSGGAGRLLCGAAVHEVPRRRAGHSGRSDHEPFYAETVRYIENLKKCGIPASVDVYHSDMHAFDMMQPDTPLSREAARRFNEQFAYAQTHYFAPQGESER